MTPEQIILLTDTCVKCGLCLPHCPTYRKTMQESDSPRGRVAIAHGLLTKTLLNSPRVAECLNRCLECHACEAMCPSGTLVTCIIEGTRSILTERQPSFKRWLRQQLLDLAIRPGWIILGARYYQSSGLRSLVHNLGVLKWLRLANTEQLLPQRPLVAARAGTLTANTTTTAHIATLAIFPGCLGRFVDAPAIEAAAKILTRLGYTVTTPEHSVCCGALHRHNGFAARADQELAQSAIIFENYKQVLTVASACLGGLRQNPNLARKVMDATDFIATIPWTKDLTTNKTPETIWVHVPCTQRHPVGNPNATMMLLTRVPGVTPLALADNDICCGAAGTYMLLQPNLSQLLLDDKLQLIESVAATTVVTTNTGCALRLSAGLQSRGLQIRVCHPLEILAERMS